ncbi:hypothetical protein [Bradyrhizobium sp. 150]|uniref:hypothetical protein n=1 Tax=Bradyrhizobium sp. 150 TaxID=2782625 RepID=UPI001FFAC5ED|nr:hypothetical protein [Bradyrhizobium sp. 150]MCK1670341.1 hypothetical protein [Bradyrhizobium sp. 150]
MNMTVKQPRVMNIMDRSGHTTMEWDAEDPVAVKAAKGKFEEYKRQGYQAFAIVEDGDEHITTQSKGRRIDEFDGSAEKIMLIPQLRGG